MSDLTLCPITEKSIILVTGEDRQQFLQGQVTADLTLLSSGQSTLAAHCSAKGKTWAIFQVLCADDHYLLITDKGCTENSLRELKKYSVFSKIEFTDVSEQYQYWGVITEQFPVSAMEKLGLASPDENTPSQYASHANGDIWLTQLSQPVTRFALLLPKSLTIENILSSATSAEENLWNALDIQAGIPKLNAELSEEYVPQMMNLQALNAISFKKGCYMGQEVVARTKYLGKNKRAGAILESAVEASIPPGETLELQLGENWRRIGTVLYSATESSATEKNTTEAGKTWAFAVLPNDLEESPSIRLQSNPDIVFQVCPLPYSLEG
ncbi:tRNA-modifying protein YgfZ [Paraneptunicella aestuarii]|uniref:tRNA-modifying protein YgfZ n=1 Tax=Paraneptunicella aestuarii TaxID=2831148 RepID=UPI001E3C50F4|nr:tRNA-modifying protein YgfZ [Paraneptunicella aestuarii]UAA40065.1 tRNA-modifying protein YgfZ [Paraneptunicella aestuarii]